MAANVTTRLLRTPTEDVTEVI